MTGISRNRDPGTIQPRQRPRQPAAADPNWQPIGTVIARLLDRILEPSENDSPIYEPQQVTSR